MTREFAALIFIGLLVLVVLVYAVFSARERSGAVEARLAAMSGLGGANRLEQHAPLAAFLRQPECQATILVMMGALLLGWFLKLSIAAECFCSSWLALPPGSSFADGVLIAREELFFQGFQRRSTISRDPFKQAFRLTVRSKS